MNVELTRRANGRSTGMADPRSGIQSSCGDWISKMSFSLSRSLSRSRYFLSILISSKRFDDRRSIQKLFNASFLDDFSHKHYGRADHDFERGGVDFSFFFFMFGDHFLFSILKFCHQIWIQYFPKPSDTHFGKNLKYQNFNLLCWICNFLFSNWVGVETLNDQM